MTLRRVAIVGPESTGKSTLAATLAQTFGGAAVAEFARTYADDKGAPLTAADVEPIARGHFAAEEAQAALASELLVVDTDVIMTTIYADIYYGACPAWVMSLAHRRLYDLYLVLAPDVPWVPDAQRDLPHRRDEVFSRIVAALDVRRAPYVVIRGDWTTRTAAAVDAVKKLLGRA